MQPKRCHENAGQSKTLFLQRFNAKKEENNKERKNNYSIKHFFQRYFYRFFSTKDFANVFTPVSPLGWKPENLSFVVKKSIKTIFTFLQLYKYSQSKMHNRG